VQALSRREYWNQFDRSPDIVVMFVPSEAIFSKAFDHDPKLLDYSIDQRVLLTTPITLLALLKAVAYGWQQHQIAEHAQEIAREGGKLHDRVVVFLGHLQELGKRLDKAVEFYNKAISSYQSRLRKTLEDFRDKVAPTKELPSPEPIERKTQLPLDSTDEQAESTNS
jgi:DNA recombination protein RmuC